MPQVTFHFSLNAEKHAHIIAWLERQENKSAAIRDACEVMIMSTRATTLDDILDAIERLEQRSVVYAVGEPHGNGDEPSAAVLALEELGL